jgi:multiple sugar transport system ATP-binding protein
LLKAAVGAGALQPGAAVTLGVRSEHLQLQSGPGHNTLPCRVQWVERLGDMTYAYLESPQQAPLTVRLEGDSAVVVGDAVHLRVPTIGCHLFDADGMALPARTA